MIRGYHEYKEIWEAVTGERLQCQRETDNPHDLYAVAVLKSGVVVGHVPRKVSSICSLFLRRGGVIVCTVTGARRYSHDLEQGGLEVPCVLRFEGTVKDIAKIESLTKAALQAKSLKNEPSKDSTQHEQKKKETEDQDVLERGDELTDVHINLAQTLLKKQFPKLNGLQSTLLQQRKQVASDKNASLPPEEKLKDQLQIIHCRGNHWIAASTVGSSSVKVYDSLFTTLDEATKDLVQALFSTSDIVMQPLQKQQGVKDCGLFAIAVITAIAYGSNPSIIDFDQQGLRSHLSSCFKDKCITPFPSL